ncbi:MAG: AsmA family protein, partial [Alphaproteobacteria bacterium]|nr:AsmA family protein [Alphaproteobacteria bacterium]
RLKIEEGKITFVDHRKKSEQKIEDINLVLKADSLKGPFDVEGSIVYAGQKIVVDAQTGRLPKAGEGLQLNANVSMPDVKSQISFDGVSSIGAPFDVQGQLGVKLDSLSKTAALTGATLGDGYDQAFALDGLLSANEDQISYDNLKLSLGSMVANGKLSVQNVKSKNPVRVSGVLKSSSVFDLDTLLEKTKNTGSKGGSDSKDLKQSGKLGAKKKELIPNSLTLPMPIDVGIKLDMAGVKLQGNKLGGVFIDLKKTGKAASIDFKVLEVPGQGKMDGSLLVNFASSSAAGQAVTYADPSASYSVNGQVGQLADFLSAFAPKGQTNDIGKLYKTANFNLKGSVSNKALSLKDSVLKLDQTVIGLGGNYKPRGGMAGRDRAYIDVSAGNIDIDRITAALSGKKKGSPEVSEGTATSSGSSPKEAVKPLQDLSLPLDLGFDVSVQKARLNQMDVEGIRLTGELVGNALTLKNASANNFAGAAIGVKGKVGDLKSLSGLDIDAFLRTSDVTKLMSALKMDASSVPTGVKDANVSLQAKGSSEKIAFSTNVKALNGQVDVSGNAKSMLDKPVFNSLVIAAKHPNMGSALEAIVKNFKAPTSMRRAINLSTKADMEGKNYKLSDLNVVFGKSKFGGNLNINTAGSVPVIRGKVQAGSIALDELLGAGSSGGKSGGGNKGSNKSSSKNSSKSGERWSKTPINLDWMNKIDLDVDLAANNITYGSWNLEQPITDLKIGGGKMSINQMKAGVFGGSMTLQTNVNASPVSLALTSQMNNIDLERLAGALSGGGKLKSAGTVSLAMDVNGTGGSAHALINALNGKANLNGTNVVLKGFDLAKMARGLAVEEKLADSVSSLVDGATRGGETKFDTLKGDYKIEKGSVNIASMAMEGDAALIKSTGYADIPNWFINTDHEITLKQVPDLKPFIVKIKGPLDNPSDTFGKNILEDYLGEKLRRKIGKELPGLLGDDVTEKLQKFGIIPKEQAPTPAPANNNAAPAPSEQQKAPVQQQKQQPDTNPLDQILQDPKGAEDALKGVLDGLF